MPTQNLAKVFQPKSVAVLGASSRVGSVGRTVLENLQRAAFPGEIFPINPKYDALLGRQAYPSIRALAHPPDLAIIATPAATVPGLVRECGEAGVPGLIILSAGFSEVGPHGRELESELARTAASFPDMRVIGPNCLGVMVPASHLNASFAAAMAKPGRVAFISQSGALCTSILDWSLAEGIGFSYFVSIGNTLNVKVGDLIDYLADDPTTDSIVLYLESVTDARRFMSAARAFTRTKPIVVYKAGRFAESAQAAASHTGAMAGVDAVYEAAFQRAGMVRIDRAEDMFDCAELLARHRTPAGPRLAIITNAGGPGVMAADELLERQGRLARRMLDSLRIRPLLHGYRGRRAVNVDRLVEVLMRFSYLISENPSIAELDVNPLLVTAEGATALDARVILDPSTAAAKPRPYSQLTIRPYPEEYARCTTLKDGTKIVLRPIRPEDEPMWHRFIKSCSERSIWQRFRYLFKETTHEMATRFCFVDYDRTMAIVAEIESDGGRQLIGVARLVADADHRHAEYALLVADEWQGRGLGTRLTDVCFEICGTWHIHRVYAETTADNQRMQNILRRHHFEQKRASDGEVLYESQMAAPPTTNGKPHGRRQMEKAHRA